MQFNTNFFDVTKGVVLLVLCFLLVAKLWNYDFNKSDSKTMDESTVTMIANNIAKNIVISNNEKIDLLIEEIKKSDSKLLKLIKSNNEITEVGQIVFSLKSDIDELKSSFLFKDTSNPTKDVDFTQIQLESSDNRFIPIADVYYSPNIESEDKWVINKHPLDFYTTIIETENDDGTINKYTELTVKNNRIPSLNNTFFPLSINKVVWEKREIKDKKFRLNYRIGLGGSLTNKDIYPNIDISFFSYGRTKRDMDWRFISIVGGGYNDKLCLGIVPASYNIGEFTPLIENLFIGPILNINTEDEISFGVNTSVPF